MTPAILRRTRVGLRRIAARLLLDDALEHARDERHAGGLDRLQVARRQQPGLRGVAASPRTRWRAPSASDADARQRPCADLAARRRADSKSSLDVGAMADRSSRSSPSTRTSAGPSTAGTHSAADKQRARRRRPGRQVGGSKAEVAGVRHQSSAIDTGAPAMRSSAMRVPVSTPLPRHRHHDRFDLASHPPDASLYPGCAPRASGHARPRCAAHDVLGGMRQRRAACRCCSCTAGPAAAACRITAASTTRRSGASCSTTSAARGARRRSRELTDNTTAHLVDDIERLRAHLGIDRWLLFGGSWGSTLALAYAQAHPERVLGLVLRGIFLATPARDRLVPRTACARLSRGVARVHAVPAARGARRPPRATIIAASSIPTRAIHCPAAHAWDRYESTCSTLLPKPNGSGRLDGDAGALAIARIEAHYFVHDAFLGPTRILANMPRIRHLPVHDRAGPLRHHLPAGRRRRARPRVAGSRVRRRARRRPLGARAGHRRASSSPPCSGCRTPMPATSDAQCRSGRRAAARPSGIRARR